MIILAEKTLVAIDNAMQADGGNRYRALLQQTLPQIADAYRSDEDGVRSHLGASVLGNKCLRAIWYSFRWVSKKGVYAMKGESIARAVARYLRLWNRGHIEEGRMLALMHMIGVQVYQQDANGNQFKMSDFGGHFGGSCDGILIGVPDLPEGVPCLSEYKTHNAKSFKKLQEEGVKESKAEHYVQMQVYMLRFGLSVALYLAVCKDDDQLYGEIVPFNHDDAFWQMQRASRAIFDKKPERIRNASPGFFLCKFCEHRDVCFKTVLPQRNCRTCEHVRFREDGTVRCSLQEGYAKQANSGILTKADQMLGCEYYRVNLDIQ